MILLVQAAVGTADGVAAAVSNIPGVVDAAVTSGPYDVIGHVPAQLAAHDRVVVGAVLRVPGVARVSVCRSRR